MSMEQFSQMSDDDLASLLNTKHRGNISHCLEDLGCQPRDPRLRARLVPLRDPKYKCRTTKRDWSDRQRVIRAISENLTYTGVLRDLGLQLNAANIASINRLATLESVSLDHFDRHHRLKKPSKWTSETMLTLQDSRPHGLRPLVIKWGVLDYKCQLCGNPGQHNGRALSLQLDHIDGNPADCRIENLRFLCPNCHTQSPTYQGRKRIKQSPN